MLIIPSRIAGSVLKARKRHGYVCPLCCASHTDELADNEWVELSLPQRKPLPICLGCCIDIFNTSRIASFEDHPYFDIVANAAQFVGMSTDDFRYHCLQEQLRIIDSDPTKYTSPENQSVMSHIKDLLASLRST